jgi:hypothetical protein
MKQQAFSIYDKASGTYANPIFAPTKGVAIRSFTDEANNTQSMLNKHPEDYFLYYMGEFDQETGTFTQVKLENLGNAKDFLAIEE